MNRLKRSLNNLGIESWIFGLTGLVAVIFSLVGFFGFWPFDQTQTTQILIGAIGTMMLAIVTLTAKRQAEIMEIKDAIGLCETRLLSEREYWQSLPLNVIRTKRFILDTFLNWETPRASKTIYQSGSQFEYQRLLFERLTKRSLSFRQVQVVYHQQGLEELIYKLLLFEDVNYKIRHYDPPPVSIPILHVLSIDDEAFYLGVGYPKGTPVDNQILYIREPQITHLLKSYWRELWEKAIPLNEGGINWAELKRIGFRLGINDEKFNLLISNIKNNAQRDKYRLIQ